VAAGKRCWRARDWKGLPSRCALYHASVQHIPAMSEKWAFPHPMTLTATGPIMGSRLDYFCVRAAA
jgi:hypothetical protein